MYARLAVMTAVLAMGCTAAFRTASGGATAKAGVAGGTTNSVYFGDRGGLLTRAGLVGLGVLAAAGSVHSTSTVSTYDRGDAIVTTTTTTSTVNAAEAANAQKLLDDATDPRQNYGGLGAGLEIAARTLGGDTSGWMFDFGPLGAQRYGAWGIRWSVKLGFGQHTFHDRLIRTYSDLAVMETRGDSTYSFLGVPARIGITYRGLVELFAQLDLNLATVVWGSFPDENPSPSPWRTGARVTLFEVVYVEAQLAVSSMRAVNRTYGLEAGLAF